MRQQSLKAISQIFSRATELYTSVSAAIFSSQPSSLGYPGSETQSAYYPGTLHISANEIGQISQIMEDNGILPENTRVSKVLEGKAVVYEFYKRL